MNSRTSIHELVERHYEDLKSRADHLRAQLKDIEVELEAAFAAAQALGLDLKNKEKTKYYNVEKNTPKLRPNLTLKQASLEILKEFPRGLKSSKIIEIMGERFGMFYPRSSLSPQLSRLKHEGKIIQDNGKWLLSR